MSRQIIARLGVAVGGAIVVGFAWLLLAPTQFGGSTAYALVVGNSMEPVLQRGDLAVVRARRDYRPGDIVLYDSRELGAKVLHRIVRVESGRFVLKGDNNAFLDPERPGEEAILGELAVAVPAAGAVAEWVREPTHMALLVGLATLLALSGGAGIGVLVRRHGRPIASLERQRVARLPGDMQLVARVAGPVLVLSAALALVSFTRPETVPETVAAPWAHEGALDYSARVPRSPVYPDGRVSNGEPVFLRLVSHLRLRYEYRLSSQQLHRARGTVRLDARLVDGRGWERVLPLAREREFDGSGATASAVLDLDRVEALVRQVGELTGSSEARYSLSIMPTVTVDAVVAGSSVRERFEPVVKFELAEERLQLADANALPARRDGTLPGRVAADVALGRVALPVATARWLSLTGLVLSLALGLLALLALRRRTGDEPTRIERRYGHMIVKASHREPAWPRATVLGDIESLARLASHHDRLIVHLVEGGVDTYAVEHPDGAYVYRAEVHGSAPIETSGVGGRNGPEETLALVRSVEHVG